MKEQIKIPEKELNKMEISNLSDAEFKILHQDAQGTQWVLQQHKKTQAERKITLSKIKKNLQGINTRVKEAENQISVWNIREQKTPNQNSKKKKES